MNNNENEISKNVFISSDFTLVTLLSIYFPIFSIDKSNPKRIVFAFERSPKLKEIVKKYIRREITIEPQIFTSQERFIKTQIYSYL